MVQNIGYGTNHQSSHIQSFKEMAQRIPIGCYGRVQGELWGLEWSRKVQQDLGASLATKGKWGVNGHSWGYSKPGWWTTVLKGQGQCEMDGLMRRQAWQNRGSTWRWWKVCRKQRYEIKANVLTSFNLSYLFHLNGSNNNFFEKWSCNEINYFSICNFWHTISTLPLLII